MAKGPFGSRLVLDGPSVGPRRLLRVVNLPSSRSSTLMMTQC